MVPVITSIGKSERWHGSMKLWQFFLTVKGSVDPEPNPQSRFNDCSHRVWHLLTDGQACVYYGAAEFSRECDIVIISEDEHLTRLNQALAKLQVEYLVKDLIAAIECAFDSRFGKMIATASTQRASWLFLFFFA